MCCLIAELEKPVLGEAEKISKMENIFTAG